LISIGLFSLGELVVKHARLHSPECVLFRVRPETASDCQVTSLVLDIGLEESRSECLQFAIDIPAVSKKIAADPLSDLGPWS
jgi:hypothetical protein